MFSIEARNKILHRKQTNDAFLENERMKENRDEFMQNAFKQYKCQIFSPMANGSVNRDEKDIHLPLTNKGTPGVHFEDKICSNCGEIEIQHGWNRSTNASRRIIEPCRDYGTVTFNENGRTADFVRVAGRDVEAKNLLAYVNNCSLNPVNMTDLDLIVSLHGDFTLGDAASIELKEEMNKFKDALTTVLVVSNAWLISVANESQRVIPLVEAEKLNGDINPTKCSHVTSVGFEVWDAVQYRRVLCNQDSSQLRKYPPDSEILPHQNPDERILTPECTHYILVDTASSEPENQARLLRNLRFNFEEGLVVERTAQMKRNRKSLPVLNILARSQYDDALNMMHKLRKNEDVVILKNFPGFGRKMVEFLSNPENVDTSSEHAELWTQLSSFQNSPNLHVLDLSVPGGSDNVFSIASNLIPIAKQIKLAVYDKIEGNLAPLINSVSDSKREEMVEVFKTAVTERQFEVIEGILSSKLSIEAHFDDKFLQDIYKTTTQRDSYLLSFIYQKAPKAADIGEDNVFTFEFMCHLVKKIIKTASPVRDKITMNKQLLIFAILRLDKRMSDFFWRRCDEPMTAALFAKIVLQSMKQSECFGWNKKLLVELEDYYESKASEVLIKLFEEDPAIASQSLRSKQESWYGYTPLELAERGVCKAFFSQLPVERVQTEMFFGNIMTSTTWPLITIYVLLFFPCFIWMPWCVDYKGELYVMKGTNIEDYSGNLKDDSRKKVAKSRKFKIGVFLLIRSIYSTPLCKCILDTTYNLIFVVLQSYMLLVTFKSFEGVSDLEWTLFALMVCSTFKSLVLIVFYESLPWQDRLWFYLASNKWYFISMGNSLVFIFGTLFHFYNMHNKAAVDWSQGAHVFSVILSFAVLLRSCLTWAHIGPYIIMMQHMFYEMGLFLIVVLIFTVCYGVCMESIVYPNDSHLFWPLIYGIIIKPYLHLFGENFLDQLAHAGQCRYNENHLFEACSSTYLRPVFGLLLFIAFSIVVNIMLINLLIAVFSNTYNIVKENSNLYWNIIFYRVAVVYYSKPLNYPPPLFVFIAIADALISLYRKMFKTCRTRKDEKQREKDLTVLMKKQNEFKAKKMEQVIFHRYFVHGISGPKLY